MKGIVDKRGEKVTYSFNLIGIMIMMILVIMNPLLLGILS